MPKIQISIEEWYKLPANERNNYYYVSNELGMYFAYKDDDYRKHTGDGYSMPEVKDDFDELMKGGEVNG